LYVIVLMFMDVIGKIFGVFVDMLEKCCG
jgi:hypothetical protein